MAGRLNDAMNWPRTPIDPFRIADELRKAAAELRQNRTADLSLAQRLERRAEAVLFPDLPRWWADEAVSGRAA
jgi:hypothetical protein